MPAESGSFILGNQSGRLTSFDFMSPYKRMEPFSYVGSVFSRDSTMDANVATNYTTSFDGGVQASTASVSTSIGTKRGTFGSTKGILLAYDTTLDGIGSFGRGLQVGVTKSISDGSPSAPCLSLDMPGMWRFRWVVQSGTRTVSVRTKQNSTGSCRPSLTVKSNPRIGLTADVSGSASDAPGWVTIGPVSFVSTGTGDVWVELRNNCEDVLTMTDFTDPSLHALFDHIVTT